MPFAWVAEKLRDRAWVAEGTDPLPPLPAVRLVPFADGLQLPAPDARISARLVAKTRDGRLCLDFRDSDAACDAMGFGTDEADTRMACAMALGTALGTQMPDRRWLDRFELRIAPHSWIGAGQPRDPGRRAMSMARVFDTVLGALASAWPGRVGAGSNSLGALVELAAAAETVADVVAGGEGGLPHRPGRSGWSSPLLAASGTHPLPRWVEVIQRGREGSGGGGARSGGDGVERRYEVGQRVTAHVGIDRIGNPPHGIDRAGPPQSASVTLETPGEAPVTVAPWRPIEVPAGATLTVRTAGGAGHGFGGYGDIEFDASEWFGSKPAESDAH